MKTKQDGDVFDRIGTIYNKIIIELSWSIRQDTVYHKKIDMITM